MPWVVAYRLETRFTWTVVDDPLSHARATRLTAFLKSCKIDRSRNLRLVYARYYEEPASAAAEVRSLESMPIEANIALIEEENPQWLDYVTRMPDRLRLPGSDGRRPRLPKDPDRSKIRMR